MKTPLFLLLLLFGGLVFLSPLPARAPKTPAPPPCGTSPTDWCTTHSKDPCGRHLSVPECQLDPECVGMPYPGEYLLGCRVDERGFGTNCPTVGCLSRCEPLSKQRCEWAGDHCLWENSPCRKQ